MKHHEHVVNKLGLKLWHITMIWYVFHHAVNSINIIVAFFIRNLVVNRKFMTPWAQHQPAKIASGRAIDDAYPWVVGHSCRGGWLWGQAGEIPRPSRTQLKTRTVYSRGFTTKLWPSKIWKRNYPIYIYTHTYIYAHIYIYTFILDYIILLYLI